MTKRLVVAYGGSLEGAAAISSLAHALDADVATLTLDLGQGVDLEQVRDQARAAGARRAHVVDARRELAGTILRPALTAGAGSTCASQGNSLTKTSPVCGTPLPSKWSRLSMYSM